AEESRLRARAEDIALVRGLRGPAEFLLVEEEEGLPLLDGPAFAHAELIELNLRFRETADRVEVVVRVQRLVAEVLVGAAVVLVPAAARHPFDRHRALARAVGAGHGTGDRHLF